jgi:ubiquitin C-terminal hydrolase
MKILADKTILENDSAFFCSKCNSKQRAEKSVTLNQMPAILMLTL